MTGGLAFLLLSLVGPFEEVSDQHAWSDQSAARAAAAKAAAQGSLRPIMATKIDRRARAEQRRQKQNDINATLRAMSLMRVGFEPQPRPGTVPNR
jgi:hypothetical protein